MSRKVKNEERKRFANNEELDELLKKRPTRPMSITKVAEHLTLNRSALSMVLSGNRPGTVTWRKLGKVLTKDEWECARQFAVAARKRKGLPDLKEIKYTPKPEAYDVVV